MNESTAENSKEHGKLAICVVEGCGRFRQARGLCMGHLKRLHLHGDVRASIPIKKRSKKGARGECVVEGCTRSHAGKGYCQQHLFRVRKFGDPKASIPIREKGKGFRRANPRSYQLWWTLRMNCTNPRYDGFKNYGAKGLSFCPEWNSYERFVTDIGERPSRHHVLVLNEGETVFGPGTCRWEIKAPGTSKKCKITYANAEEIRALYTGGASVKKLAHDFGVSEANIYLIIQGKIWK